MACSMYNRITKGASSSIGKVYFYEMLGTIVGGVLVSYILIPTLNSFEIAIGVASLKCPDLPRHAPLLRRTKKNNCYHFQGL